MRLLHYTSSKGIGFSFTSTTQKINKIFYFADGATAQYKNRNNFKNLSLHEEEFGTQVRWNLFASTRGKGPCDGVGWITKKLATKASLEPRQGSITT